jgi:hypothetical protein
LQVLAIQVLHMARAFVYAVEQFSVSTAPTNHPAFRALKNSLNGLNPADIDLDILNIIISAVLIIPTISCQMLQTIGAPLLYCANKLSERLKSKIIIHEVGKNEVDVMFHVPCPNPTMSHVLLMYCLLLLLAAAEKHRHIYRRGCC